MRAFQQQLGAWAAGLSELARLCRVRCHLEVDPLEI
jgi:hypothetical protein